MDGCMRCNGADDDDELFWLYGTIDRFGWAIEHVMADLPWTYTIGLAAGFDHPELIVVGLPPGESMDVLNRAGRMISEGARFETPPAGLSPIEPRLGTKFHDVHPDHWGRGLLAVWDWYYDNLGSPPSIREAVQLVYADADGRFPDHPDHDLMLDLHQPLLARSPEDGGWDHDLDENADRR